MPSLYDFLNRHQIYIEGVKNWYHDEFRRYLRLFQSELRKLFGRANVGKLGELTASKFRSFMKVVETLSNKIFGQYGSEFLTEVRRFLGADVLVQRSGFASITGKDVTGATVPQIWKEAREAIVPAFGKTILEATSALVAEMKEKVRVAINTGYADDETIEEIETRLKGVGPEYKGGVFANIWSGARAHISTALQHVSAKITDTLGGFVFDCYQWGSVIDGVTSDICRERNGNVYRRGEGPLPPAHRHCRSRAIPCPCDTTSGDKAPTYFAWLKQQSADFLNDVFGDGPGGDLVSGRANAADYNRFSGVARLTVDEFALKVKRLLS